ncbi:DUF2933 domain-containing protein [Microbaculum sp. FT89]|uniref:DUF2933 domain-containing protein n=1 Tax=Microbaculum sp. FT89 TaxID=3447298 RepID=UPI003F533F6F
MREHDHSRDHSHLPAGSWTPRAGFVLVAFLAVAGFLLAYEHRLHAFTGTGILVALLGLCVGMHLLMHGRPGTDESPDRRGHP